MDLKEHLVTHGYDQIDILLIDEEQNQSTVAGISLHKMTDLEYKLYLDPQSLKYELNSDHPHFIANQKEEEGEVKQVKGYILKW
ncbi:hypothetical protein MUO14_11905 [Halobacillus shinanisalinarum]|uniref:Uncharacterized protein n=1 Tax=Halobacillus shinanisalinarum TaxID=2932258 RepID=A0ABY4H984_9BACI|nr:hypothetical protein [Halobacillus shinanisalinarum]UOQ95557.1 hypothetical protein MUO14_11905 [Halobacillus shinanisalinarum]